MTGCYVGEPFVLWGTKDGFKKPVPLRDRDGNRMHTGRYYDTDAKKHTSGPGPGGRAYSAFPVDWDEDGDLDLLVGTDRGQFHLRMNEGSKTGHAFARATVPVLAAGEQATVDSYAMPIVVDWDRDGRWDLVSGNKSGHVFWFRNVGKVGAPRFESRQTVIEPSAKGPKGCAQIDVGDFDGDGDLDVLVGDKSSHKKNGKYVRHGFVWLYRNQSAGTAAGTRDADGVDEIR